MGIASVFCVDDWVFGLVWDFGVRCNSIFQKANKDNVKVTVCIINDCERNVYENLEKCILHCKKSHYAQDFHETGFLDLFYEELLSYIVDYAYLHKNENGLINKNNFRAYLDGDSQDLLDGVIKSLKSTKIVFTKIFFPERDNRDSFDYKNLLKKLDSIHFNYCEFTALGLNLGDVKIFFQECEFHQHWAIYNAQMLDNRSKVVYQQCVFNKTATVSHEGNGRFEITHTLFDNCNFKEKLEFYSIKFNAAVFNNNREIETEIKAFDINDCVFDDKFILNNCHIGEYNSDSNVFNSKFEFKSNTVQKFEVTNTNHMKVVDAFKTKFKFFRIHKSIFEDYVGLQDCEFGMSNEINVENIATFMYVTFLSFVNLRNTVFTGGLDIEHINLKESPNFLYTKVNPEFTNRESFRIIKNSFDKIGNHIEANKFFAYEMQKYKIELSKADDKQTKFIVYLNEKISNFGQSYIRPIIWMGITALLYKLLVLGHEYNLLYSIYPPFNDTISVISSFFNGIADSVLPFSKFLREGMEAFSLLFYVVFASLIWQTLVAVKRHTRR